MTRTVEKIENDLERARRERDAKKNSRGGQSNNQMTSVMVSALNKRFQKPLATTTRMTAKRWILPDSM